MTLVQSIKECFSNKEYRLFLACSLIFHFGWQMGWPLFNVYQISFLKADEMWLTIINAVSSLFMVISFAYWGKIIKKKGFEFATAFATFGMALTPLFYFLTRTLLQNTLMQPATGFFTAGITIVILGSLLETSSDNNRTMSVALHATLTSVTLSIAPLIGNMIHSEFGIQTALLVTSGFRMLGFSAFFLRYLLKRKSKQK